jgi:hypothetical protein
VKYDFVKNKERTNKIENTINERYPETVVISVIIKAGMKETT